MKPATLSKFILEKENFISTQQYSSCEAETGRKDIALKKSEDERPHTDCGERTEHDPPVPGKLCLQWDR